MIQLFLLSSKNRQNYLIEKNACMFLGLQNFANNCDDDGDVRCSMKISGESYKYLYNFVMYCDARGIDQIKCLQKYDKSRKI